MADYSAGLQVIDVSKPTNCVRVGGYNAGGLAYGVAVVGNYAYVADWDRGLQVIDVSNPTNCVRVAHYDTSRCRGVAVADNRIYVADYDRGLIVLCSLPNVQYMMRVDDGTPGLPFTIEAASTLSESAPWTLLCTTNPPSLPFEFTDFDVRISEHPQKFYRVRQAASR